MDRGIGVPSGLQLMQREPLATASVVVSIVPPSLSCIVGQAFGSSLVCPGAHGAHARRHVLGIGLCA